MCSMNAPLMVDPEDLTDPLDIARKELKCGKIPFIIRRKLPDSTFDDWKVDELEDVDPYGRYQAVQSGMNP